MIAMGKWLRRGAIGLLLAGFIALAALNAPRLHLLGFSERTLYPALGAKSDVSAVFLSGDMGLRIGMSKEIARGLAAHGHPVIGVSTPVAFVEHLTRAQTDAVVADAIDDALTDGARKVVLVGQSFGADILATAVPDLPGRLRTRVGGVVLVVPSNNVHFRADPSGVEYRKVPDARPAAALAQVTWTPLACIHGVDEPASLCGMIKGGTARDIALPGDHYLHHDAPRVLAAVLSAISDIRP